MSNDDDDKGGYGRPPKRYRFKKGQSGNPKGRRRKSTSVKECLRELLSERIRTRDGRTTTVFDLTLRRSVAGMAEGKFRQWEPTLRFLEGLEPKGQFTATSRDIQRFQRFVSRLKKEEESDGGTDDE